MGMPRREGFEREALPRLPELLRVALRQTGDPASAEDAVQETFLRAWRGFDRYRPGTNCRAWLYRILFFVLATQRRRNGRDRAVPLEDAPRSGSGSSPTRPTRSPRAACSRPSPPSTPSSAP